MGFLSLNSLFHDEILFKKHIWLAAERLPRRGHLLTNYQLYKNPCPEVASALCGEGHNDIPGICGGGGGGSPKTLEEMKFLGYLVAKV